MHRSLPYRIVALIGFLSAGLAAIAAAPVVKSIDPPQDILFIGNSFTYYNNGLHKHLRTMMREGGKKTGTVRSVTVSGGRLKAHEASLRYHLSDADWDVVILQGNSMEAIDAGTVAGFHSAVRQYGVAIRDDGAHPVLFMTWARSHLPEQTAILNDEYTSAGNEAAALVVPVGLAFARSSESNGITLRIADRRHPTLEGTYLAACTFYAALFRESPVGHSYTAGLDESVARTLQVSAWEAVTAYYGMN